MRIFPEMNTSGKEVCPVCNTKENKPVTLLPVVGTQEGNLAQAIQVHVECLKPVYDPTHNLFYQRLEKK